MATAVIWRCFTTIKALFGALPEQEQRINAAEKIGAVSPAADLAAPASRAADRKEF
jgi:hypothetical protein